MDQLEAVRTFLRVAELASFSEAARRLGVPKSLVTRRITQLEAHLGTPLLTRTTRSVALTEAGRLYAPRARAILEELAVLDGAVAAHDAQMRGNLRIAAPTSFGVRYLGPALSEFLCGQPHLTADLILRDGPVNPASEGFDLALSDCEAVSGQFEEQPLVDFALCLVAAPAYVARAGLPTDPAALRKLDVIHYVHAESGLDWRFTSPRGEPVRVAVNPRLSSNNAAVMRDAALAGHGIALLPEFVIEEALERGALVPVLPDYLPPRLRIKAVFPRGREVIAKTRLLVEFLRRRFAGVAGGRESGA
jgi:DNA-binding transcriptional LysR family regulator